MNLPRPKWYTVDELAGYWEVASELVKRYIETGQLVSSKMFLNWENNSYRWESNINGYGRYLYEIEEEPAYNEMEFGDYILLEEAERFEKEHGQNSKDINTGVFIDEPIEEKEQLPQRPEKKIHPLEKRSLLKMVLAMAMDCYGYDPEDKKSPVTQDIVDAVTLKLDMTIDSDTVRKFLQEAASQDKDWH